jgi:outer membrane immunogenic protein
MRLRRINVRSSLQFPVVSRRGPVVKKLLTLAAAIAAFGFVGAANAADMPTKMPVKAAPMALYNWTGFYIGGHVGYGWGASDDTTIAWSDPGNVAGTAAAVAAGVVPLSFSPDPKGALGGGQIGYNYQASPNFVLGVETDFSFADINGAQTINTAVVGFFPLTESVSQKLDWFGTIRGRVGYAVDQWLFYATGGGAYGHINYRYALSNIPAGAINISRSESSTEFGWTVGGGVEYGWDKWTVRAEYLYMDLGDHSFTVPLNTVATATFSPNFQNKYNIVRVGFNYRF